MRLENDVVIKHEPYKMVRDSGRVPKTLHFVDDNGEEYWIEPIITLPDHKTAKIFYKLPIKFAREMLVDQRNKLCVPERMVISVKVGTELRSKIIEACGDMPPAKHLIGTEIEELRVKRAKIEDEELKAFSKGEVPKHLQLASKKVEEQNKEIAKGSPPKTSL